MPPNETLGQGLKIGELCQDNITNTLVFFVNGEFENMFPSFLNTNSDFSLFHLLITEIFLYYGAQKFLYWGLTTEISVPHSTENFCEK